MTFTETLDHPLLVLLAIATAVLGVGRLVRILVHDAFPPAMALRAWWLNTVGARWGKLFTCWWCMSPWVMAACIGWYALGSLATWVFVLWWVFWGWLALAYLSAIVISYDEPSDSD